MASWQACWQASRAAVSGPDSLTTGEPYLWTSHAMVDITPAFDGLVEIFGPLDRFWHSCCTR
ncbi:hypothetical protein SNOG_10666 [Parastagonospora nodorum SN15]|uniref:Uncharacterized protein n=1 Tax=Phaeosphaeria nodorum (strain SN15 / ATCC MYA-4574 / FGSC 10173) TaxID=321614 RepID=Q0UC48_PHANO|nr:hypothetical protein SNOG_10666 [Parastagonospora nodorum SN15]EAT82060.1 hypothetical protein SNOG_10666 [Parastagonospora nodorum SN15]